MRNFIIALIRNVIYSVIYLIRFRKFFLLDFFKVIFQKSCRP